MLCRFCMHRPVRQTMISAPPPPPEKESSVGGRCTRGWIHIHDGIVVDPGDYAQWKKLPMTGYLFLKHLAAHRSSRSVPSYIRDRMSTYDKGTPIHACMYNMCLWCFFLENATNVGFKVEVRRVHFFLLCEMKSPSP